MKQDIFIIGATGNVGKTLVRQILNEGDLRREPVPAMIVGLASSTSFVYSPDGLDSMACFGFSEKIPAYNGQKQTAYKSHDEFLNAVKLNKSSQDQLVFVDVTPLKDEMTRFHMAVINDTQYNIVTANKNPIALSDYHTFERLTHDVRRYEYRCSVMAGAQAVPMVQELRDLNDAPIMIEGCFSGTLGYLCSELQKGERKFSEILNRAYEQGYTETHPRDDLSGLDVARKLVVLARTAGYPVEFSDVNVQPFIKREYFSENHVQRFIDSTAGLDNQFLERMERLKSEGKTLRYVASMDATGNPIRLLVDLREVPVSSGLGSLEGTLNKILIVSKVHPVDKPYSIQSQGAGPEVTAQNIRSDLLHFLPQRYSNGNNRQP